MLNKQIHIASIASQRQLPTQGLWSTAIQSYPVGSLNTAIESFNDKSIGVCLNT